MPTFICSLGWTEQGIKAVKDAPKRAKAARELAKKLGVDIKQVYLTSGNDDLLVICEAAERRQHRQIRAGAERAGQRAHAHGPRLERSRDGQADFRTAVAQRRRVSRRRFP